MLVLVLMASGCRKTSLPPSPGGLQAETKKEDHRQPCIERPRTNFGADAAMLRTVSELGILPDIQSMTQANAAAARRTQGVTIELMAFYGDPQVPSVASMVDFSDLANDPHAQKTLGEAFDLQERKDEAGAAAVVRAMTESERSYFITASSTMNAISNRSGENISRLETPLIGASMGLDSRTYLNRMLQESERLRVAMSGMPDNRRALWWLGYRTGQLIDKLNAGCGQVARS